MGCGVVCPDVAEEETMYQVIADLIATELLAVAHNDDTTAGMARYARALLEDHPVPTWAAEVILEKVQLMIQVDAGDQLSLFCGRSDA
jgi:hypothetical protein